MSNLVEHAKFELELAGLFDKDSDYGGMIGEAVLELIERFSEQGHSGFSAGMVNSIFNKLVDYKPLGPITGKDEEWGGDALDGKTLQNKRMSSVFKDRESGECRYIDAIVWKTQTGSTWSGSAKLSDGTVLGSSQIVKFPFVPKTFCIDVIEEEVAKDDWEFHVKDESQLDEVFRYYIKI